MNNSVDNLVWDDDRSRCRSGLCSVFAFHGWGFKQQVWQPWQTLFSESSFESSPELGLEHSLCLEAWDRGYFGQPRSLLNSPEKFPEKLIVFVHSYGLHWCPPEALAQAKLVVIFGGFVTFHPLEGRERRRSQQVLQRMIDQFQVQPEAVLKAFWQRCGVVPQADLLAQANCELLLEDLVALGRSQLSSQSLVALAYCPQVVVVQSQQDEIVGGDRAQELVQCLGPNATRLQLEGPHGLPFTHTLACWQVLQPWLQ